MTTTKNTIEQWYALQTYYAQELKVGNYLEKFHLHFFIPMSYTYVPDEKGKPQRREHPAVHNLIFIQKTVSDEELKRVLAQCPYAVKIYTYPDQQKWQVISAQDIMDLRLICDSSLTEPLFISQQESEVKIGRMVKVMHGPMKGIYGKLVRKNKRYYIVKTFVGVGVMVAVSRWCCQEIRE